MLAAGHIARHPENSKHRLKGAPTTVTVNRPIARA
jgi:hypothetical protein